MERQLKRPVKTKATGFLDKLNGGIRTYIIAAGVKDKHGNNIVLHESWHNSIESAQAAYQAATDGLKMVSEFTNCQA